MEMGRTSIHLHLMTMEELSFISISSYSCSRTIITYTSGFTYWACTCRHLLLSHLISLVSLSCNGFTLLFWFQLEPMKVLTLWHPIPDTGVKCQNFGWEKNTGIGHWWGPPTARQQDTRYLLIPTFYLGATPCPWLQPTILYCHQTGKSKAKVCHTEILLIIMPFVQTEFLYWTKTVAVTISMS